MSPIPSVVTAFTLSPAAPSVALDPDSAGQSASVTSQHLLGTGGLLFAVVAIVSVAGYFYHGRGTANSTRTSNTWASLSSFLSSMRHRGSATISTEAATDCPVDLELGPEQHVSMVYARFFHPTFWNLVECHPATPSTPAIYVEDEAIDIPVSDPKLPGMSSFLDMDDDGDGNRDRYDSLKRAREKPDRGARPRVEELPPYDTSSPINVNFASEIIGTTVRPGAFLAIPDEHEDDSSGSSTSDLLSVPEEPDDDLSESSSSDSEFDFSCSAYDGISTSPPRSSSSTRRYGMANMAYLAQSFKDTIPEEGYELVPTISHRTGLSDVLKFIETDPAISCTPLDQIGTVDDHPTISNCDIGAHDGRNDLRNGSSDVDTPAAHHEGLDLMRRLLAELRDPNLDCCPRALSEDSDSEYPDDDDEASVPHLTPTWHLGNVRRNSLESTFSNPRTGSDVSDEEPIYPLTPPPKPASSIASVPNVHKASVASPAPPWFKEGVQTMSQTSSDSPPSLPTKACVHTHRDTRSLLYGPRLPLVALPHL